MSAVTAEAVEALPAGPPARSLPRLGTAALPFLLVLGLVTLCPSGAAAQGDDDSSALALLRRALVAASTASYQGTQVDATWTPNGMTTRMIDVHQIGGTLRSITVRGSGGSAATTTVPLRTAGSVVDPLTLLAGAYALALAGRNTLLGRSATEVVALRRSRVAARLWIDDASGLVLRQEVWDTQGRLTRMVGFVDLTDVEPSTGQDGPQPVVSSSVGAYALHPTVGTASAGGQDGVTEPVPTEPAPNDPAPAGSGLLTGAMTTGPGGGAAVVDPQTAARRLHSPCPAVLPGGYRLVDARAVSVAAGEPGAGALHLTYSDGLSALSVFVQAGRLPAGGPSGMSAQTWSGQRVYLGTGWPLRVVWEGGGHVFTAVSDAPVDELTAAVNALPGQRSATGVLDRLSVMLRTVTLLLPGR